MFFRQFFDRTSCTFTYIIANNNTAAIIDPVLEHIDLYLQFINEWGLTLKYSIDTHTHADHITGSGRLREASGCQIVVSEASKARCADLKLADQQTLNIDKLEIKALSTPGHTDDSMCLLCEDRVFTGDTLLIRGSGRTDFQSGNASEQYKNIQNKLFTLSDDTLVYPAHDYKSLTVSTIGEEKQFNPRLHNHNEEEYIDIMNNLNLAMPEKIEEAVPANLKCGLTE